MKSKQGELRKTMEENKAILGTSLVVQWVRLRAPNAGVPGSIPVRGTLSHMHATAKSRVPQLRPGRA